MRTGSIYDVVDVLKNLTFLSRSKNLSFREKRMLDRAKFLVVSEISEVTHGASTDVDGRVSRALERCFEVKARAAARAAASKTKSSAATSRRAVRAS
jgi:CarD family transcriptional regulator